MDSQHKAGNRSGKSSSKSNARPAIAVARYTPRIDTIGFLLWDARRAVSRDFERLITPHGVSRSTFWVLRILWDEDGLTQAQLIQRCRMKGPTIVGIVAQLEREGLVTRVPDADDSRKKLIMLTSKGSNLRPVILQATEDIDKRALKGLTAAERSQLKEMLRRIRGNMDPG